MKRIIHLFAGAIFAWLLCAPPGVTAQNQGSSQHQWTVVIDPGHGGSDPGAVSGGVREKDLVLSVGLRLGKKIKEAYPDVKVIYTRSTDVFIPLYARAAIANRNKADLFISLHANYVKESIARGTETFTLGLHKSQENLEVAMKENSVILLEEDYTANYEGFNPDETESYIMFENMQAEYQVQSIDLAARVQEEFTDRLKLVNRGVKQAGFLVLKQSTMPAVLVEMGFISNPTERKFLISEEGKDKVAESVFQAFTSYKKAIDNKSVFSMTGSSRPTNGGEKNSEISKNETTRNEREPQEPVRQADVSPGQARQNVPATQPAGQSTVSQEQTQSQSVKKQQAQPRQVNPEPDKQSQVTADPAVTAGRESMNDNNAAKYYSVQVGALNKDIPATPANFKGLTNVHRLIVNPYYKYYAGKFATFNEARAEKKRLATKFPGAFVVVVRDSVPTPLYNGDLP